MEAQPHIASREQGSGIQLISSRRSYTEDNHGLSDMMRSLTTEVPIRRVEWDGDIVAVMPEAVFPVS